MATKPDYEWQACRPVGLESVRDAFKQLDGDGYEIVDRWPDGAQAVVIIAKRLKTAKAVKP